MSKIYIVLTYSGTVLSKLVKIYTRKEYSHVSISLDQNLNQMYSFGRINPYCPFLGGFVKESPRYGTFKRFNDTKAKIYSLEVDDRQYEKIAKIIRKMSLKKRNYRFNMIGLLAVAFHLRVKRKNCFYCAEFVKYVLDNSNIKIDLPELVKPSDFAEIEGSREVYTGRLNDYNM